MAKKSSKRWKERHQEGRVAECAFRGALKTWLQYKGARRELGTWLEPWLPGKIISLAMRSRIGLAQRVNRMLWGLVNKLAGVRAVTVHGR